MSSLRLDRKLEFNEGDVGVTGGVQVWETANTNPTVTDMIRRFSGSTEVSLPWPEDDALETGDDDRFDRIETLIQRALKRILQSQIPAPRLETGTVPVFDMCTPVSGARRASIFVMM